jgi:hypothetical protein
MAQRQKQSDVVNAVKSYGKRLYRSSEIRSEVLKMQKIYYKMSGIN